MATVVIEEEVPVVIEVGVLGPQGPPGTLIEVAEEGVLAVTPLRELDFQAGFDVTESTPRTAQIDLDLSEVSAGGELAGTLDAPTVDPLHSGSTHQSITDALNAHEIDVVGAHDAAAIAFTPFDTIVSADVQAAVVEALTDARAYTDDGHVILSVLRGALNGVAELDATGKVPASELPALAFGEVFVVASEGAMLALAASPGDIAVRTDTSQTFILSALPASTLANWTELLNPGGDVTSVDGLTGAVTGVELVANKGALSGYAALDGSGYVPDAQINPAVARDTEVADALTTHAAAADPHPTYETAAEAQALVDIHTSDTTDAHDASAISILDSAGQYTSTDVEGALAEVGAVAGPLLRVFPGANDATTNDGPALQALHDALPATGGTINLDGNRAAGLGYLINSQVVVSKPNVSIVGQAGARLVFGSSAPNEVLKVTGDNCKLLRLRSDATAYTGTFAIRAEGDDFELGWVQHYTANTDCSNAGALYGRVAAVLAARPRFRDCLFDNVQAEFYSCTDGTMEANTFTNVRTGIYNKTSTGTSLINNTFLSAAPILSANIATSTWAANVATYTFATDSGFVVGHRVDVRGVTGHTGYNVTTKTISTVSNGSKTITVALTSDPGGSGDAATGTMTSSSIGHDAITNEADVGGSDYACENMTIRGNHILAAREHGIYNAGMAHRNVVIEGNTISGCHRQAIKLLAGSGSTTENVTITGNTIGPGALGQPVEYNNGGIYIARAKNVTISGNSIRLPLSGTSGNTGIYLLGGISNVTIDGNTISDIKSGSPILVTTEFLEDYSNLSITNNNLSNARYGYGATFSNVGILHVEVGSSDALNGLTIAGNTIVDSQAIPTAEYGIYLKTTTGDTGNVHIGPNYGHAGATGFYYIGSGWRPLPITHKATASYDFGAIGTFTNLLLYSEQFNNAAWVKLGSPGPTVTANAAVAPDGATTADSYVQTGGTGGGASSMHQSVTAGVIGGGTFTASVWVKATAGAIGKAWNIRVDDAASENAAAFGTETVLDGSWQYVTFTYTFSGTNTGTTVRMVMFGHTMVSTNEVYLWGAQLYEGHLFEDTAYPGIYYTPTTSAASSWSGVVVADGSIRSPSFIQNGHAVLDTTTGVTSLAKSGSSALAGAVTLSGGTGITLTETGQDIQVTATGAAAPTFLSIAKWSTN